AIRAELGPEAVIVHQSETKKGPLGFFAHTQVEVVAAVDDARRPAVKSRTAAAPARPAAAPAPRPSGTAPVPTGISRVGARPLPGTGSHAPPPSRAPSPYPSPRGRGDASDAPTLQSVPPSTLNAPLASPSE